MSKSEVERLKKIILDQRKEIKELKEKDTSCPTLIESVAIAVQHTGLKLYTTDGKLINSITWEDLDQMRKQTSKDSYLMTEGKVSPQTQFRETFQNFLAFCNSVYLPPEIENIPPELINNEGIDPNTRAFLDMVIHYEKYFEKNENFRTPFTRFLKWMCYLFKEDHLMRERVGWMFWWWIVKHGNKLILWESMFDPRHWAPFTDTDIDISVTGPQLATPLSPEKQMEVMVMNEKLMKENLIKVEEMKNGRQGAT